MLGRAAIFIALTFLAVLAGAVGIKGYSAFTKTYIALDVKIENSDAAKINFRSLSRQSVRNYFPKVKNRNDKRKLYKLFSSDMEFEIKNHVARHPEIVDRSQRIWISAAADIDMLNKGFIPRDVPETDRKINDRQLGWYDKLVADGRVERRFNMTFFTASDSREPEQAGILGAAIGSAMTLLVTLILVFPVGVASAVYLEEIAPNNRWTDLLDAFWLIIQLCCQ